MWFLWTIPGCEKFGNRREGDVPVSDLNMNELERQLIEAQSLLDVFVILSTAFGPTSWSLDAPTNEVAIPYKIQRKFVVSA